MSAWVLVTRGEEELASLRAAAPPQVSVVPYPVLRLVPWEDPAAWEAVSPHLGRLDLLVFTSRHAPLPLLQQATSRGASEILQRLPAAAVGQATASACRQAGFQPVLVGDGGAQQLAEQLRQRFHSPWVLHPCGREHRQELKQALETAGGRVFSLPVYAMDEAPTAKLPPLPPGQPLAVLATSPRAARAYWRATSARYALCPHFALGSTTARELAQLGLQPKILEKARIESLWEELCRN